MTFRSYLDVLSYEKQADISLRSLYVFIGNEEITFMPNIHLHFLFSLPILKRTAVFPFHNVPNLQLVSLAA